MGCLYFRKLGGETRCEKPKNPKQDGETEAEMTRAGDGCLSDQPTTDNFSGNLLPWSGVLKGERWDSNPRMAEPQSAALTTWPRSPCFVCDRFCIIANLQNGVKSC